jgi:hypothetical protein
MEKTDAVKRRLVYIFLTRRPAAARGAFFRIARGAFLIIARRVLEYRAARPWGA